MRVGGDQGVAKVVGLELLVAVGHHVPLGEHQRRHEAREPVADAEHLLWRDQRAGVEVALDTDAIRRCACVEKLADARHVVFLLEAGVEGTVLVDPEGPVGEPAGGADHIGIKPVPEHFANRLRRVRPAHGMIQHVEIVDERTGLFNEQTHVIEQPVAERRVGRTIPRGE